MFELCHLVSNTVINCPIIFFTGYYGEPMQIAKFIRYFAKVISIEWIYLEIDSYGILINTFSTK